MRKEKKNKARLPTVDEFLQYVPKRTDFEWYTEDNLVRIKVPKFTSNFGKSFCNFIKKDNMFIANLDKMGSLVWVNCDGRNNVKQILDMVMKEFSNQKDIDQRLFLFLQQMKALHYIDY